MNTPYYLELDFEPVTEWLPEPAKLSPSENDAWIMREIVRRWKPGEDRGSPLPVDAEFTM
jgi:hypothetical protein